MAGRVGQCLPGRAVGQPGGAKACRPLGLREGIVGLQVEVERLRVLLPGPLRRNVVGGALEFDLLTVRSPYAEPLRVMT